MDSKIRKPGNMLEQSPGLLHPLAFPFGKPNGKVMVKRLERSMFGRSFFTRPQARRLGKEVGKGGAAFLCPGPLGSLSLRIPASGAHLAPVFSPWAFQEPSQRGFLWAEVEGLFLQMDCRCFSRFVV